MMNPGIEDQAMVSVTCAAPTQAPIIQNLMQLYTHDFSEFWGGTSRGDLNAQGLFDAYPLEEYWSRANWSAMLIWCDQVLAGFSLVNNQTHSGLPALRNMAEFFILRKYRGRGGSRIAAEAIFSASRFMGSRGDPQECACPAILAQDHPAIRENLEFSGTGSAKRALERAHLAL